jgi:hypothetical protein
VERAAVTVESAAVTVERVAGPVERAAVTVERAAVTVETELPNGPTLGVYDDDYLYKMGMDSSDIKNAF